MRFTKRQAVGAITVLAIAIPTGYAAGAGPLEGASWAEAKMIEVPCVNGSEQCFEVFGAPREDPEAPTSAAERNLICDRIGSEYENTGFCDPPTPPANAPAALRQSIADYRAAQ